MPIALHPRVTKLWIVRPRKSEYGEIPKAEYVLTPAKSKLMQWKKIYKACRQVVSKKEVKAVVSFNPIPYGMLAHFGAQKHHKPTHLGFIGADWNKYSQGMLKPYLIKKYKSADFITVTGSLMKEQMINNGLDADKISILPHPINVDRFPVGSPEAAEYDFIFVGELIQRKRVDTIIDAFSIVNQKHPEAKLCIIGHGPLEEPLRQQVNRLGLNDQVDFIGYTHEVNKFLVKSKNILVASESEGFPFSLVEGICCGLVPVTTPVGTIRDHISDNKNGLFFTPGNFNELADKMLRLTEDHVFYCELRDSVLNLREDFSYESATRIWNTWFQQID
jgi:glycosyltransferase involved in cell wall biosynthesis